MHLFVDIHGMNLLKNKGVGSYGRLKSCQFCNMIHGFFYNKYPYMYQTLQPLFGPCYVVDRKSVDLLIATCGLFSNIAISKLHDFSLMNTLFDVNDKVVVLAGHQGRLGISLADCLVQEGAIVVLLGACPEEGRALVDAMVLKGGEACFFQVDYADPFQLLQVQEDIMLEYGRIDALVYELEGHPPPVPQRWSNGLLNAEPGQSDNPDERRLETLLVNTRTFLKPMLRQKEGVVVYLLDYPMACRRETTCVHRQTMTQLDALTKSLAGELALTFGPSYRVNALMTGTNNPAEFNPDNLQGPLQYLLSDAATLMTGEVMVVDGGFHIFADSTPSEYIESF